MTTIKAKLNLCRITKSGKYSIVFQVIHDRKCVMLSTGIRVKPENFDSVGGKVICNDTSENKSVKEINKTISSVRRQITDKIRSLENGKFTVEDIRAWYKQCNNPDTLFSYMERMIEEKKGIGKYGIASAYRSTLNSLQHYSNKAIKIRDITCAFVRDYELYLRGRNLSSNTIAYYMRNLRTVYNRIIEDIQCRPKEYPFRKIRTAPLQTIKRALFTYQIKAISVLDLKKYPKLELTRDIFMASFYMRGTAFVDLAHLKRKDIVNGYVSYYRQKTGMLVSVQIIPPLQKIIDTYSSDSQFVFPQLFSDKGYDYDNVYKSYRTALIYYNRRLKQIGRMAGLTVPLTGYMARHTWATTAKIKGASTSVISEGMGHSSERITQVYLKSFDNSIINQLNQLVAEL